MSQIEPNQPTELDKRKTAGKAGKLWGIEVLFNEGAEVRRYVLQNRYWEEVMKFRGAVYNVGLMVPVSPGHWKIVAPWDIENIYLTRQNDYFKEY